MKLLRLMLVLVMFGIIAVSCSNDDDDNGGGTSGGSGEVNNAPASEDVSAAPEETAVVESDMTDPAAAAPVDAGEIWLDAFSDFDCSGNWTERDGALGLVAYSGSGSCSASFPGVPGTYQLVLAAQTEFDGNSPYQVAINGATVAQGEYPLSSPLGCDCPLDDWRNVCPDRDEDIDLGTHTLDTGDVIEFYGDEVYPCGSHGSYAKWHGIKAIRQ